MKRNLLCFKLKWLVCMLVACTLLLFCGLTAFAAEEGSADKPAIDPTQTTTVEGTTEPSIRGKNGENDLKLEPAVSLPSQETKNELYPSDVQRIIDDNGRQIIKTYILAPGESPLDIPRESFTRDGWRYTLTDITEKKSSGMDNQEHTETVTINTDTDVLNTILKQFSPTMDFQSDDGYSGVLALDLSSVKCEAAGYKNSSYTVTATREYPHLSSNDLSLIPKTITDNGKTLTLDDVAWEAQQTVNVDYEDVPDSYRAVAKYSAKASKSVVTGYVTTANYVGTISKMVTGDTVYTAYFVGSEINPKPTPTPTPTPFPTPITTEPSEQNAKPGSIPILPLFVIAAIAAVLGGLGAFFFLRHNVKVYTIKDSGRQLVAKVRISPKNPTIDLTPLSRYGDKHFSLDIERLTAKRLNGKVVEVVFGTERLTHQIAFEGNAYKLDIDFHNSAITAIY